MSLKELAQQLIQDINTTEAIKEYQRQRAEKAEEKERLEEEERKRVVWLRKLREDRKLRETNEALKEAQRQDAQNYQKLKQEKLNEYLGYCKEYLKMKEDFDKMKKGLLDNGVNVFNVEAGIKDLTNIMKRHWQEPYKSKCNYTPEELMAFAMDPFQAAMWVSIRPSSF